MRIVAESEIAASAFGFLAMTTCGIGYLLVIGLGGGDFLSYRLRSTLFGLVWMGLLSGMLKKRVFCHSSVNSRPENAEKMSTQGGFCMEDTPSTAVLA